MTDLTRRLTDALANRATSAQFDLQARLDEVLQGVGLAITDAGGRVSYTGADPVVKSPVRIGAAATICLLAKSIAAAAMHRWRGAPGQDIAVDLRRTPHRLSPFYDGKWERIGRYPVAPSLEVGNALGATFFRTGDGRWTMPQAMYANLRLRSQELLGVPLTHDRVSEAIGKWNARELEEAAARAGAVFPMVRTLEEMMAERHYKEVLAGIPLIEVIRIGDSGREPLPPCGAAPFSGFRALGMGHVIAGAGLGRSLALHGAEVLNLWKPGEGENDTIYASANVGLRSAWLHPQFDRPLLLSLLRDADIFFHNRRPAYMRDIGLTPEEAARERPGIIYVSVTVHGDEGPWAERAGFDQTAGAVSGIMALEGSKESPQLPATIVVNDYLCSWLAQTGVVAAIRRRAEEGGSYHVRISLTRTALWMLSLGIFDREWAHRTAGSSEEHLYLDPETFTATTALGDYQGVTDQVMMSLTPGSYDPVLSPRGASRPAWLGNG